MTYLLDIVGHPVFDPYKRSDVSALKKLSAVANRVTYSRAKAEAMGFTFDRVRLDEHDGESIELTGEFWCVCGRREKFSRVFGATTNPIRVLEVLDVAAELWRIGSFSRAHLIGDGYSLDQIKEFERKAAAFEASPLSRQFPSTFNAGPQIHRFPKPQAAR